MIGYETAYELRKCLEERKALEDVTRPLLGRVVLASPQTCQVTTPQRLNDGFNYYRPNSIISKTFAFCCHILATYLDQR
jgi:hypothetical protein